MIELESNKKLVMFVSHRCVQIYMDLIQLEQIAKRLKRLIEIFN